MDFGGGRDISDVLKFRMEKLGRFHEHTIRAERSLAQSNFNLFDLIPCISGQRHLLETNWYLRPSILAWTMWPPWRPDRVPYCITLSDLTSSLWFAGRLDWSRRAGERAVKGLMKRLGPDDPLTLTAMFNVARTYQHLLNQRVSRALLVEVLRKRKRLFGLSHPDTLMARTELGMSFRVAREKLAVAERLVSNVLATRRVSLGEEHAYTLWSMNDLARVLTTRRRPQEAIVILEKVVPEVRRTLGDAHAGMTMTKANLAQAYVRAERWDEAETLLKDLVDTVPKTHPDWVVAILGSIYVRTAMGHAKEAEMDCLKILDALEKEKILSADGARTLAVAKQLSLIYENQERWKDVEALKITYPKINSSQKQQFNIWLV